jgi:hypothetical protein
MESSQARSVVARDAAVSDQEWVFGHKPGVSYDGKFILGYQANRRLELRRTWFRGHQFALGPKRARGNRSRRRFIAV